MEDITVVPRYTFSIDHNSKAITELIQKQKIRSLHTT